MSNNLLFLVCALIWGTTWIAITYQHGDMSLVYSVGLRFLIATFLLACWCYIKRLAMDFSGSQHLRMMIAGLCLYALDYSFLYFAQQYIVSALLAVLSVSVVYFNVALRRILFSKAVRWEVVLGAFISAMGLWLLFGKDLSAIDRHEFMSIGLLFATLSFFFAALANVLAENIMESGVPVIQFNFFAMSYSLVFTFGYATVSGEPFVLPRNAEYWGSLIYLSIFGTVIAFGAYMKLVNNIGADKAANVILVYPVVALLISTLFEGYLWTVSGFIGIAVVLTGNAIAMDKFTLKGILGVHHYLRQRIKKGI